ncbi:MAG: hypothetical protein JWL65_5708 [Gammaproteobacteria bacterium]|nr:hypothetical protein [Gammaproteobacteria bacterium]
MDSSAIPPQPPEVVSGVTADIDSVQEANFVSCVDALTQLRTMADKFSSRLPPAQSLMTLQVVFVAGTANPWRLVETVRSTTGPRRRMLCFDSLHRIWRCVEERLAWQRADEQFVATHMTTPGGFPGVTADWVPSRDFDLIFGPQRDAIRHETCTTSPNHIVTFS